MTDKTLYMADDWRLMIDNEHDDAGPREGKQIHVAIMVQETASP